MLEKLAKHHYKWISMVVNMGCSEDIAEDLVQEMYLRLHRLVKDEHRIMFNDDINRYFVYITLKNMFISYKKNKSKIQIFPIFDTDDRIDDDLLDSVLDENAYFQYMMDKIDEEVSDWDIYDRQLFERYYKQGYSQREIARRSGIGLSSVNNSCKNIKRRLRDLLSEDIEDYKNRDYNFKL